MGRTLHYNIKENKKIPITDADWERIHLLTRWFITNFKWTCEQPSFSNIDYYPRWPDWFRDSKLPRLNSTMEIWEYVTNAYEELEAKGLSTLQILRELNVKKFIAFLGNNPDKLQLQKAYGFTKVAGNEFNALLVTAWITAISHILPNHTLTLYDEGEFLTKELVIKNGMARPKYGKVWRKIGAYCRPVNPGDFKEHPQFQTAVITVGGDGQAIISGGSQIMAGFYGEYFQEAGDKIDMLKVLDSYVQEALKEVK